MRKARSGDDGVITGSAAEPGASFFQLKDVRAARARGVPHHVIAHEDVLVFGRAS
jgi:hypothetical protein